MQMPFPMAVTKELREAAAKVVLEEIGLILARINSSESGRIMETIIQLLPDDTFKSLAFIVIGNETDDVSRALVIEFILRIANKLGLDFESVDPLNEAAGNALVMINCESLRRKGHIEYLAPDDVFSSKPKHPGFNKLTESGKLRLYTEMLEMQSNPKHVM